MPGDSATESDEKAAAKRQAYECATERLIALAVYDEDDDESEIAAELRELDERLDREAAQRMAELRRELQGREDREPGPDARLLAGVLRHAAREFDFLPEAVAELSEIAELLDPGDPERA